MNYNFDKLKELNPDSIKKADPKDYILLLAISFDAFLCIAIVSFNKYSKASVSCSRSS